ncbi:MAG: hypothetical protein GKR77_02515 [Legionellales bacterium]|nr:hypothetical protein [Legionellales bacterium]
MTYVMKTLLCVLIITGWTIHTATAAVYIEGYHLKDGAYVRPHWIGGNDYGVYDQWLTPEYIALYSQDIEDEEDAFCADRRNYRKLNRRHCCYYP